MTVTTRLKGRLGNNFYQIATSIAYAHRHGAQYIIPMGSPHMPEGKNLLRVQNTSDGYIQGSFKNVIEKIAEREQRIYGLYEPIPNEVQPVCLDGYWQSFRYFDDYRDEVVSAFNLPYNKLNMVSIHVRRGDYLKLPAFDVLPIDYYNKCISYFKEKGYDKFLIFSDDIDWCKEHFNNDGCKFLFRDGFGELHDFVEMSCCEHNIVANSSFSFAAAWLNQNPDKIVLCPDESYCWFNDKYIPDYYTKISIV